MIAIFRVAFCRRHRSSAHLWSKASSVVTESVLIPESLITRRSVSHAESTVSCSIMNKLGATLERCIPFLLALVRSAPPPIRLFCRLANSERSWRATSLRGGEALDCAKRQGGRVALSSPGAGAAAVHPALASRRDWRISAKTPLNAKITGGFTRDGYRVEHLVFESQPKFYVTANVYVPTNAQPPFPAVLGVAGHSATGKAIDTYQHAWIGMVKRGFFVLAFDPPGQGERSEYFDPALGKSSVGIGVSEHNMAGTQPCSPARRLHAMRYGTAFARSTTCSRAKTWIRSELRVAGNSGGGTQSAYLAVLEPRLAASRHLLLHDRLGKALEEAGAAGRGAKLSRAF